MDIKRIDGYSDGRFAQTVLYQHGAYLISGDPYEIEITGRDTAEVRGKDPDAFSELIEYFRFHAPHITRFLDAEGSLIAEFPEPELAEIELDRIQPSQFFIDEDKVRAVRTFIRGADDIIIQAMPWESGYIALDGHTRLYLAVQSGFRSVRAVMSETDDWVWKFVDEARRRRIFRPEDMKLLPHEEYEVQWNRYCDSVFAAGEQESKDES